MGPARANEAGVAAVEMEAGEGWATAAVEKGVAVAVAMAAAGWG